jgi:hypothetical protein
MGSAYVALQSPPLLAQNIIEISGLSCDTAKALHLKMDDEQLTSGNIQATANCTAGSSNPASQRAKRSINRALAIVYNAA